jgi:hypothetical protein
LKGKENERERADSKVSCSSSEERRSHEKPDKKSKNSLDRKSEKKQSKESSRSESRTSKHHDAKASPGGDESYKKHKKRASGLTRFLCGRWLRNIHDFHDGVTGFGFLSMFFSVFGGNCA